MAVGGVLEHAFNHSKVRAASAERNITSEKRAYFLKALHLNPARVKYVSQKHTSNVIRVLEKDQSTDNTVADGLITQEVNVPLAVLTADCLPVFMVSQSVKPLIALIHAGWRGLHADILKKACAEILKTQEGSLDAIQVIFGPAICETCYHVGPEFKDYFSDTYNAINGTFSLHKEATRQLLEAGVREEKISSCGYCTSCHNNQFYSVRKEPGTQERILNVITLTG